MNTVPSAPGGGMGGAPRPATGGGLGSAPAAMTPGGGTGAKADIARLLEAVIKYDASDLHLAVGRPPAARVRGEMHNLGNTPLTPDDTTTLMKSITPERHQQSLGENGGADFGFAFGDQARFRVSIFKQKGVVGLVLRQIPNKLKS